MWKANPAIATVPKLGCKDLSVRVAYVPTIKIKMSVKNRKKIDNALYFLYFLFLIKQSFLSNLLSLII